MSLVLPLLLNIGSSCFRLYTQAELPPMYPLPSSSGNLLVPRSQPSYIRYSCYYDLAWYQCLLDRINISTIDLREKRKLATTQRPANEGRSAAHSQQRQKSCERCGSCKRRFDRESFIGSYCYCLVDIGQMHGNILVVLVVVAAAAGVVGTEGVALALVGARRVGIAGVVVVAIAV
jgi:hypothetical protein